MAVWMTNPTDGAYALVEQDAVDPWRLRGWQPATKEPTAKTLVWLHHAESDGRAQFPASAVEQWTAKGWLPGAPPEPVALIKDPRLTDQPAEPEPETPKTAAGRQPKTKGE